MVSPPSAGFWMDLERRRTQALVLRYQARLHFPKLVHCWHTDSSALLSGQWQAVWSQATAISAPTS